MGLEWPEDDDVCGLFYYDGEEYREARQAQPAYDGKYGGLGVNHFLKRNETDSTYSFFYSPRTFINKTQKQQFELEFRIDFSDDQFESRHYIYTEDDDNKLDPGIEFFTLDDSNSYHYYEIKSIEISFSDILVLHRNITGNGYTCRIDYSMEVLDSLGRLHLINGWAIPNKERDGQASLSSQ